ncbi:mucin-2 [Streptomyces sp. NPDC005776]|uniref:mucin-2 n=1 Tax=Streptomyces sp. NPDC005776 TaxID=3154676 RepID=UPI0033ECEFF8
MPWFKIDDSAHSHPKFMRAGNAALGLWLRCGSYSAQHLLEGFVPKDIVKPFKGTPAQVQKLIDAGLWHDAGHDCTRCPQPAGGYMIHDFFEGGRNTTRAQHEANKRGAAERAAKSRESRKRTVSGPDSNNIQDAIGSENDTETVQNQPAFPDSVAGQGDLSHRTPADGAALAQATSMPSQVLPTEVPPPPTPSSNAPGTAVAVANGRGEVQPLIEAMAARQMNVSWTFSSEQWLELRDAVRRVGVPALVDHAARAWSAAKNTPYSARYFLAGWTGLQDAPQYTGPRSLTAGPPSKTTSYLESMAAIADELRAAGGPQ